MADKIGKKRPYFGKRRKNSKNMKKPVDKWGRQWYSIKAVRETVVSKSKVSLNERTKNHLTVRKKFLTSEPRCGKLIKSPARATK